MKRLDYSRTAFAKGRAVSRRTARRIKIAARFFPLAFNVEA